MVSQLISMCASLIALWCVIFWSRERVFRFVMMISIALHAVLLIPFWNIGLGNSVSVGERRLVNYTFIQGAPEEEIKDNLLKKQPSENTVDKISLPDTKLDAHTWKDKTQKTPEKKTTIQPEIEVDSDLPEITDRSLFSFEDHPVGESYRKELKQLILTNLEIPEKILKQGYEGKQLVYFELTREGKLNRIFIAPKYVSTNDLVNTTSIENIKKISKMFPPLPQGVKEDHVWFQVEIDYEK